MILNGMTLPWVLALVISGSILFALLVVVIEVLIDLFRSR